LARTLLAVALPALAVGVSWIRLEDPRAVGPVLVAASLAVAPALVRSVRGRIVALVASVLGISWLAFGAEPWELLPYRDERVVSRVVDGIWLGIGDYYGVVVPFDPARRPEMEGVLLLAVFGFVAVVALLVALRRPLLAGAVTIAGVCWPATLLGTDAVAVGALALAATLAIPLVLRARSPQALIAGAGLAALVVAGAAWTSSATTFNRDVVGWQSWSFGRTPARALGVRFVWDANYEGIAFPTTKTVVLRISGSERAQYWRASTLDSFINDRWYEDLRFLDIREAQGDLGPDPLLPRRAAAKTSWLEQSVEVRALVDDRLVAAGTPVSVDAPSVGSVFSYEGGVLRALATVDVGTRYRVWSYVASPSPRQLAAAPARYPSAAERFLAVWGRVLPPFGSRGRAGVVRRVLADPSYESLRPYARLYEEARRVTAGTRTPYAAVLALEAWLRQSGGFRYEERPLPAPDGVPPLVHFVTETRAGYCQHYAGAMALMLRLLGIPARVAVGFTSGDPKDGAWAVSDRNAHAWVEAWFAGQGWVPFDPTPGRGTFSGTYTFASDSPTAVAALRKGQRPSLGDDPGDIRSADGGSRATARPSIFSLALAGAAALVLAIGLVKWVVRRARYLTKDPRRVAAASRRELEAFLRDQGVAVPESATLDDLRGLVESTLGIRGSRFFDVASRGRFGPPDDATVAARSARDEVRALLARARSGLSLWARARGFVSLRSLRGWQG
jgi:transglutaminase-like putative cysteine protease